MIHEDIWHALPAPSCNENDEFKSFCDAHMNEILACLPSYAAEIADAVGIERMIEFIKKKGGIPLYITKEHESFNVKHGLELSKKAHSYLLKNTDARGTITMPSAVGIFLAIRRAAIISAIHSSKYDRDIALHYGASLRYIKKMRHEIYSAKSI